MKRYGQILDIGGRLSVEFVVPNGRFELESIIGVRFDQRSVSMLSVSRRSERPKFINRHNNSVLCDDLRQRKSNIPLAGEMIWRTQPCHGIRKVQQKITSL